MELIMANPMERDLTHARLDAEIDNRILIREAENRGKDEISKQVATNMKAEGLPVDMISR